MYFYLGLGNVPSDFLYDDLSGDQISEISAQLEKATISKQQETLQKTTKRKQTTNNLIQYDFDDSEDETYRDDPAAWALASRTGTNFLLNT